MSNWYVLLVKTGREKSIAVQMQRKFNKVDIAPLVPLREKYIKVNGSFIRENKILFPGYVFIESEKVQYDFNVFIQNYIRITDTIFTLLSYDNNGETLLRTSDISNVLNFCKGAKSIECSVGFIVGDSIHITGGPLAGYESTIKKINRHKREATIDIEFMGDIRQMQVGLEIVSKT